MDVNILVNLFDIHNEAALLTIDKLKPDKVTFIVDEEFEELYKKIYLYYIEKFKSIKFESYVIKTGDIEAINKILYSIHQKNSIINITGSKRINSLILLNQAIVSNFKIIYVDVLKKKWYSLGKNINVSEEEFKDIMVEELINLSGADIVMDSSELSEKKEIIEITKNIHRNLELWYKYKSKLYDGNIFVHDSMNPTTIIINLDNINDFELKILKKSLDYLKSIDCIKYNQVEKTIKVIFTKNYVKSFIFKSGTWLEVLTNIAIKEITEVDEAKSGVVFMWNEGQRKIRNELDVVAVKDSVLICISCKDSEKYDENALNELDVYSKKIGGSTAKRILVATKNPLKECVAERAKAMDIDLIVLDKDINNFKEKLRRIINKK